MCRFFILDEYRLNFIFVKFLLHHTKSLKSNFLTPKSYLAPATVKFYTLSNFGRANKLRLISYKQAGSWVSNFTKRKAGTLLSKKTHFWRP